MTTLLKKSEVADRLSIDISTLEKLMTANEISFVKMGPKTVRITDEALTEFIARKTSKTTNTKEQHEC